MSMDLAGILQAITNVGFPIAVAVYLLWRDKEVMGKFTEVIQENTAVMQSLKQEFHEHFKDNDGG